MSEHPGLLGFLCEAQDIKAEFDIPFDEALRIQRERAEERLRELEAVESNVIQFRPREH